MLKVVTLLSTLRDPTQVKQRRCATRQQPKEFVFYLSKSHMPLAAKIVPIWNLALGKWSKTQIVIAHQKEGKDRTKKVSLVAKKRSSRD